jgi:hypothetical protein
MAKPKPAAKTARATRAPAYSAEEVARYLEAYFATRDGYADAIDLLKQRRLMPDATREERFGISAEILQEEAALAKLTNRRRAFQAGTHPIQPPTAAQVAAIKQLVDQVDRLTADGQALRQAISLTGQLAQRFAQIQAQP